MNMRERLAKKWDHYVLERKFPLGIEPSWWMSAIVVEMEKERDKLFAKADATKAYPANAMLSTKGNAMNIGISWLKDQMEEEK